MQDVLSFRQDRNAKCDRLAGELPTVEKGDLKARHQIESPKRPTKESAQGRLPQSINVEIRTELEKRVLYAL
jgi:hypothetical protein